MTFKTRIQQAEPPAMPEPVAAHFEWEGATPADGYWSEFQAAEEIPDAWDDPPTRRTDLFSAAQVAERDAHWQAQLDDLKETHTYFLERSAQRSQRLWQWAHEELSEPLKTRYFNIVANGTADWMEQPVYAQQFNSLKHERDALLAERDQLRAEVEALRADAERWRHLRDDGSDGHGGLLMMVHAVTEGEHFPRITCEATDYDKAVDAARKD